MSATESLLALYSARRHGGQAAWRTGGRTMFSRYHRLERHASFIFRPLPWTVPPK